MAQSYIKYLQTYEPDVTPPTESTYNPLVDTRPYYYAKFTDVRGSYKLFGDVPGDRAATTFRNSTNGEEF